MPEAALQMDRSSVTSVWWWNVSGGGALKGLGLEMEAPSFGGTGDGWSREGKET